MNGKFLTKLLNESYRNQILAQHAKIINDSKLQIKQYATYVVDKHAKDRKVELKDSREFFYGYDPIDIISYCANDNTIKKLCFEFKTINHFLHENKREIAVDVVKCILVQIIRENKDDVMSFDIDKIDADAKELERQYTEKLKSIQNDNKLTKEDNHNEHRNYRKTID